MFTIAFKTIRELIREPKTTLMIIFLPMFFLSIFATAYNSPLIPSYKLIVKTTSPESVNFLEVLKNQKFSDGRNVFEITPFQTAQKADEELKGQKVDAVATITTDSKGIPSISLRGDAISQKYNEAGMFLGDITNNYNEKKSGINNPVKINQILHSPNLPKTFFDVGTAGIIVFSVLLIIIQAALMITREIRYGTLKRLRLSKISAAGLLGGFTIALMVMAVIQVTIVLLTAYLWGISIQGSIFSAFIIALIICFSSIGIGFLLSCFMQNDNQSANVGGVAAMIIVFLSGAFFPIPKTILFYIKGHSIGLFDFLPATHGVMVLQNILGYGFGFKDLLFNIGLMTGLSILIYIIGIFTFHRLKMAHD